MSERARSEYLRRLPIGRRLSIAPLEDHELFPFEGDIRVRVLEQPRLPEPERVGIGGTDCRSCADDPSVIWRDVNWKLRIAQEPSGLPVVAVLLSRAHHDLEDLPSELAAGLGPMIQRVARAIGQLADVGRVHVNRWGDGGEHFHLWFLARPKGMWQMRGAMLAVWDDLLPKVPQDEWDRNRRLVADGLATGGGEQLVGG